ncbi:MAG: TIGR04086 family membrane protein [Christensenellaceae bacterium]|jgi:putative membrane protein (TIGR04086 family)|nr:TIGR04086 family membrane protein [Christensenellaceae bacterium]
MKQIMKGVLWATVITLVFVLTFAFIINIFSLGDAVIKPVIQVVKVLSIFIGVAISLKNVKKAGWLIGAFVGALYIIFAFCIFSAVDGKFSLDLTALNDAIFSMTVGVISAIILRGKTNNISV